MTRSQWVSPLTAVAVMGIAVTTGHDARAGGNGVKEQCVSAAEDGQSLRDEGKLRAARDKFVACSRTECPGAVTKECTGWLDNVDERLPTVIVAATDASGNDLVDVKVTVDGQPFLDKLTGQATPMDPGPHKVHYEYKDQPPIDETIVIKEREKGRALQVKFGGGAAAGGSGAGGGGSTGGSGGGSGVGSGGGGAGEGGIPTGAWIAGGVGVLGLASFAFFGITGYAKYNDLKDNCSPNCSTDDTDSLKTKLLVADISLGVGVVGLGVAAILILTHPKVEASAAASTARSLTVTPLRGGGFVGGYTRAF